MNRRNLAFVLAGLAVALVIAFVVSRYASSEPDGLERVAIDKGFDGEQRDHLLADTPFADYETDGVGDAGLATGIAGVLGVAATFVLAGGLVVLVSRRRPSTR